MSAADPRTAGASTGRTWGRILALSLGGGLALVILAGSILAGLGYFADKSPVANGAMPPSHREGQHGRDARDTRLSPLVLDLPQPRFVGTPINLKSPILEKPRVGSRPELRIPAGATNVALHKPVTASDKSPTLGELSQVTDGDKEGIEGSYVEIGAGKQYFQVDLQAPHRIYAIVVWHYHAQARIYHDVIVQISSDPNFAADVRTLFNNDHDNSSGLGPGSDKEYIDGNEGLLIDAGGTPARYVRLWGNGNTENDLNHCTEIEVYGEPIQAP